MRFTVDDTEYEVDLDHITYDELEFVHDNTGLGLWAFSDGLRDAVPKAIKALIIIGKRRAGIATRWQDIPGSFEIGEVSLSVLRGMYRPMIDAMSADAKAEESDAKPGPTTPGETPGSEPGTDPESASAATSSDSPTASDSAPGTSPG